MKEVSIWRGRSLPARLAGVVSRLAGIEPGIVVFRRLRTYTPAAIIRRARERARANLDAQHELECADFSIVLERWGVREEDVPACVAGLRRAVTCGFCLAVFSLLALALSFVLDTTLLVRVFSVPACLSVTLAGLVMGLAARWRAGVLQSRRFTPFTSWLRGRADSGL